MARRLPPLSAFRVFEAAGRLGSFAAAAAELNLTRSAVSHALRGLEDALSQPLFARGPGSRLALTEAGRELVAEATAAFDRIEQAVARLERWRAGSGLRVSAAPTFAARWLTPRLPELHRLHPAIAITLTTEKAKVTLGDGRCDIAVRMAAAPDGEGIWHLLEQERLLPLAAPAALRRIGTRDLAAALRRLPMIHVTTVGEDWDAWAAEAGVPAIAPLRRLRFDTIHMALEAAAQGAGIVMGRLPMAAADIAAGRLVPLGAPAPGRTAYWIVARQGLLRQRDARQFLRWMRDGFGAAAER